MLYNPWGGAGVRPPLSAIRHRRYKERNFRHDSIHARADFQSAGWLISFSLGPVEPRLTHLLLVLCDQPYGCREFGIQDIDSYDIGCGQPLE